MKTTHLAIALLGLTISDAAAESRYQTMRMGCDEVRSVLRQEGAAILRWQSKRVSNLPLYGRYVSNRRYCKLDEVAEYATVPTSDRRACPVRKCVVREPLDRFGRGRILIPN